MGDPGVLDDPLLRAFLETAAPRGNAAGLLRLRTVRLIAETLAGAAQEGCAEARFLRGAEPYKTHWAARPEPIVGRTLLR